MHRFGAAAVLAILAAGSAAAGQAAPQPTQPAAQTPPPAPQPLPGAQQPQTPAPTPGAPPVAPPVATPAVAATAPACPLPVPPATAPARAFTGRSGMLLYQVVPTRVADFDTLLNYLRDALARTTSATIREQAKGWEFYRMQEPGPNGDVLYVFVFDPAVPCVEYGFFPILSSVYTDPMLLTELHRLYTGAVRTGGTLMNLVPVPVAPPQPLTPAAAPAAQTPPGQTPVPGAQTPAEPASRVPVGK
jgi:hypothetical protein